MDGLLGVLTAEVGLTLLIFLLPLGVEGLSSMSTTTRTRMPYFRELYLSSELH